MIVKSGMSFYLHKDLVTFIRSFMEKDDDLIENDNILFFPTVDFKRELLTVSATKFNRVIQVKNATAIVVPDRLDVSKNLHSLVDKKFILDPNGDYYFYIYPATNQIEKTLQLWTELYQRTTPVKGIKSDKLTMFINSGVNIDESNYYYYQDLAKRDPVLFNTFCKNMNRFTNAAYLYVMKYFGESIGVNCFNYQIKDVRWTESFNHPYTRKICETNEFLKGVILNKIIDEANSALDKITVAKNLKLNFKLELTNDQTDENSTAGTV